MAATMMPRTVGALQTMMQDMPHMPKRKDNPRKQGKRLKDRMTATS